MFEAFDVDTITSHLIPREAFRPWARYEDEEFWAGLPDEIRAELIRRGEARLEYEWPSLLATRYMDYLRNGNRSRYEAVYFERRRAVLDLTLAECVERKGRFLDQLVNGLWLILEETSWTLPAHDMHDNFIADPLPDADDSPRDLFACETAALVAGVAYMMTHVLSRISRRLGLRMRAETLRRVVRPVCREYSFWSGIIRPGGATQEITVNNWAPWCTSTTLLAVLLLGETEEIRAQYVRQALTTLEIFAGNYGEDGGCDEGPGYFDKAGGAFFDTLDLIYKATGGAVSVFHEPKVRAMGEFPARVRLGGSYYTNFADCHPVLSPDFGMLYNFGRAVRSDRLVAFAAELARAHSGVYVDGGYSILRRMGYLPIAEALKADIPANPEPKREFFPDIQVLVAREGDLTLAAKGGHNDESHNHNDIGSFVLYRKGQPALIDAGTLGYTARTFSTERYSIWTMRSAFHTLPSFGGREQHAGRRFAAARADLAETETGCRFTVDAGPAWGEGVDYVRTLDLAAQGLTVEDRWTAEGTPVFHFLSPDRPRPADGGWIIPCAGGDLRLTCENVVPVGFTLDAIAHNDANMSREWQRDVLYRLNVILPEGISRCAWILKPED